MDLAVFEGMKLRREWKDGEWWFSVIDVIAAITGIAEPRNYWQDMKRRDTFEAAQEAAQGQLSAICRRLKLMAADGKLRDTDCANVEGLFRIIQSIPSPKAEAFKMWLAKVGKERLEEIENPALAVERAYRTYKFKGYSDEWIRKRMEGINTRKRLTDEWKQRGATGADYAKLTSRLTRQTFGMRPDEIREYKGLGKSHAVRDHMDDVELALVMLGEATSTKLHKDRDSLGFQNLSRDTDDAGRVAGSAREQIEKLTGKPVLSQDNYLETPQSRPRLEGI